MNTTDDSPGSIRSWICGLGHLLPHDLLPTRRAGSPSRSFLQLQRALWCLLGAHLVRCLPGKVTPARLADSVHPGGECWRDGLTACAAADLQGALTCAFAILMYFCLPWTPSVARFLSPREKEVARYRLLADGSTATDTKFAMKTFFAPLWDWKFWVFAPIALCYGTAAAVGSNFLTQIIGRYHYTVVKTNLWTVAPFCFGTIVLLITAWSSDHFRERGFHLASSMALVLTGCIILAALPITEKKASYFAVFLITGAYTVWPSVAQLTTQAVLSHRVSCSTPGTSVTTPPRMVELSVSVPLRSWPMPAVSSAVSLVCDPASSPTEPQPTSSWTSSRQNTPSPW